MFAQPTKSDLDRALSQLMHETRHKLIEEQNRINGDAAKAGAFRSSRVVVLVAKAADDFHKSAIEQAQSILLDFVQRLKAPAQEVTGWAHPHLENMSNSLIGEVKPNGFPDDRKRLARQYQAVFQQRVDGMLRDVEIGRNPSGAFAPVESLEIEQDWITANEAMQLAKQSNVPSPAVAISTRAHRGLVHARAQRFVNNGRTSEDVTIEPGFWWAKGHAALTQNWITGDFDTWIDNKRHLEAFGVTFLRSDIEMMLPQKPAAKLSSPPVVTGGRPTADWWDDLWVEIFRRIYNGDFKPKRQVEIETAMKDWLAEKGKSAADSTIKPRARKLWQMLQEEDNK